MEDDDMDFTPTQGTSSNLASLFGFTKTPPQGNSSLTYTAPKAPKKDSTPIIPNKVKSEEKPVGKIICSKAVQAYKLENRSYVSQGLSGIVISGNHTTHTYELILYKPNKEVLTKTRITRGFSFTVAVNNYLSFYDNNKQNWSIMFQSPTDVQQFIEKLSISKFYSYLKSSECLLIQDLIPASQSQTQSDSIVEVVYSSLELEPDGTTVVIKSDIKERVNLSAKNIQPLNEGLAGCWENCKRLMIAPHSLSGFWMSELDKTKDLMLKVQVERITTETKEPSLEPRSNSTEEGIESPIESSAEESSIKARGVSIKEALTSTKSQKANLISRMARMGQATLPLKQPLTGGPSDSEEEIPVTSSPKPRVSRGRGSSNNSHQSVPTLTQTPPNPETVKQISVYQNDLMWQQAQLGKVGVIHQQLVPVSGSPITSPTTDPNLSVYVSESRIQAAELRMGLSKVSEKLDLVWNKLQNVNSSSENKIHQSGLVDTTGILSSIQSLVTENENLRVKVEEQKGKLDQQSDRIFQLLELNHKYLEQNSTSHEKQSENEIKLKTEVEQLRKKEIQLEEESKKYSERVVSLERDLEKAEKSKKELEERIEELNGDVDRLKQCTEGNDSAMKKEMKKYEEKIEKASESIALLKEKLMQTITEREKLRSAVGVQREELEAMKIELEDSRRKKEEYERAVESLKGKLSESSEYNSKMEELEKENKSLSMRLEKEKKDRDEEVKKVLRQISTTLKERFSDSEEYSGSSVLSAIEKLFNDVVNGCSLDNPTMREGKGDSKDSKALIDSSEDSIVLPKPRTSLKKPETSSKDNEENKTSRMEPSDESNLSSGIKMEGEKEEKNEGDSKENVDSRYKSYDQSWRTTKPPPPPLFDDDDDDDDWLN